MLFGVMTMKMEEMTFLVDFPMMRKMFQFTKHLIKQRFHQKKMMLY